jgi:hypothetical protein
MWAPSQLQGRPRHRPAILRPEPFRKNARVQGVKGALSLFGLVELRWQGWITMVGQRSLELAVIDAAEGQRR